MTDSWRVAYFPTIMTGPVARFVCGRRWVTEISASRDGVCVETPRPVRVNDLRPALDAAERVHLALRAAYDRDPLRGPGGSEATLTCIRKSLGDGWSLDEPRFGEVWPPSEP